MKLTKFENRVLDSSYPSRCRWSYLYLGIGFIVTALLIAAYGYVKAIPQLSGIWDNNLTMLQKITPVNDQEQRLFDIAASTAETAKEGWENYTEEKIRSASVFFLISGCFLLGIYYREKRYKELIDKLRASNHGVQSDAGDAGAADA